MLRRQVLRNFASIAKLVACAFTAPALFACAADPTSSTSADAGPIVMDGGTALRFTPMTCPSDDACGGDIIGTWTFLSGCVVGEDTAVEAACSFAAFELRLVPTGTLDLGFDNLFQLDLSVTTEGDLGLPAACYEGEPGLTEAECQSLGPGLTSQYLCARDGEGGCHCSYDEPTPIELHQSGTYLAGGGQLLLDDVRHAFCVRGNTLILRGPPIDGEFAVYTLARSE